MNNVKYKIKLILNGQKTIIISSTYPLLLLLLLCTQHLYIYIHTQNRPIIIFHNRFDKLSKTIIKYILTNNWQLYTRVKTHTTI